MRMMLCRNCGERTIFEQLQTRPITGEPDYRRRWFVCVECGRERRTREIEDADGTAIEETKCDPSHFPDAYT